MLKRYIAISFIYISYVILLAHNISSHTHNDIDNEHHNSKGIGHIFDHYLHSPDSFTTTNVTTNVHSHILECRVGILPINNNNTENVQNLQLDFSLEKTFSIYISPHWHCKGLRAPPTLFV